MVGMLVGYVDDVMLAIDESDSFVCNVRDAVKKLYEWGTWEPQQRGPHSPRPEPPRETKAPMETLKMPLRNMLVGP